MLSADRYQYTFAVIGDTHVKPETGDQSAPWKVNDLATGRARWIAREISRYNPRFVVHLGDLVHPVPELPTFAEAVTLTKQVFQKHHNVMHVIPGNHDIGDKPNRMMPAKSVRDDWIAIHERNFGSGWSTFDQGDIRFVLINNPVLNSGSSIEKAQRAWLEQTLASAASRRVFLFMHYPLFLLSPSEPGTYDNIDEPARSDFLALIKAHKVEAVFAGHVHNISYHRLNGAEFYVMPSTSFVRQDFADMYRIEAAAENGRNDAEKLGFGLVDVYDGGHIVHYLRSYGETLAAGAGDDVPEMRSSAALFPHPKKSGGAPFGVFLRHAWAETVTLPHNGPMDEFQRKRVRNDYPVATMWRLGIRDARVPFSDLIDDDTRTRMADLAAIGHRFAIFSFDLPQGAAADHVVACRDLIDRFEVVLPRDAIAGKASELQSFRKALRKPVLLSPVATSADEVKVGSKIELFVSHGFRPAETKAIGLLLEQSTLAGVDGFVFRAHLTDDLPAVAAALASWSWANARKVECHLRIASSNPAENITDDGAILSAAAELFALGLAYPDITFMLDTFMDVDRGYFVRHGLIDRRCNLRPAGTAIEALAAHLGSIPGPWSHRADAVTDGRVVTLAAADRVATLVLPQIGKAVALTDEMLAPLVEFGGQVQAIPLDRPWTIDASIGSHTGGSLPSRRSVDRPSLILAQPYA